MFAQSFYVYLLKNTFVRTIKSCVERLGMWLTSKALTRFWTQSPAKKEENVPSVRSSSHAHTSCYLFYQNQNDPKN